MKVSLLGQRVLATLLTLAALTYVWAVVIQPPVQSLMDSSEALDAKAGLLSRYEWLVANENVIDQQLQELSSQSIKSLLYSNMSSTQSAVHFQNSVNQMLRASGASVQNLDILPAQDQSGFTKISLRLAATLTQRDLLTFLTALQHHDKAYVMDVITLRSNDSLTLDEEPRLFFQAEISAYLEGNAS